METSTTLFNSEKRIRQWGSDTDQEKIRDDNNDDTDTEQRDMKSTIINTVDMPDNCVTYYIHLIYRGYYIGKGKVSGMLQGLPYHYASWTIIVTHLTRCKGKAKEADT